MVFRLHKKKHRDTKIEVVKSGNNAPIIPLLCKCGNVVIDHNSKTSAENLKLQNVQTSKTYQRIAQFFPTSKAKCVGYFIKLIVSNNSSFM